MGEKHVSFGALTKVLPKLAAEEGGPPMETTLPGLVAQPVQSQPAPSSVQPNGISRGGLAFLQNAMSLQNGQGSKVPKAILPKAHSAPKKSAMKSKSQGQTTAQKRKRQDDSFIDELMASDFEDDDGEKEERASKKLRKNDERDERLYSEFNKRQQEKEDEEMKELQMKLILLGQDEMFKENFKKFNLLTELKDDNVMKLDFDRLRKLDKRVTMAMQSSVDTSFPEQVLSGVLKTAELVSIFLHKKYGTPHLKGLHDDVMKDPDTQKATRQIAYENMWIQNQAGTTRLLSALPSKALVRADYNKKLIEQQIKKQKELESMNRALPPIPPVPAPPPPQTQEPQPPEEPPMAEEEKEKTVKAVENLEKEYDDL